MILTILLLIGVSCVLGALLIGERAKRLEEEKRADDLASKPTIDPAVHKKLESDKRNLDIENSKLVARNAHLAGRLAKIEASINEDH